MAELDLNYSPQELTASFQGPAPYSNKILLTATPFTARLSFLEISQDGLPYFRTAVSLAHPDVVALRDMLTGLLNFIEAQQKAASDATSS